MDRHVRGWIRFSFGALLVIPGALAGCGDNGGGKSDASQGDGGGTDGGADADAHADAHADGDAGGPTETPTNLTALLLDRRQTSVQLTWTAPIAVGGGSVAGYQVRY